MAEETVENAGLETGGSGGGSNKLVTILTIVNLLAVLGMGALLYLSFQKQKEISVADISTTEGQPHQASAESDGHSAAGGHGSESAKEEVASTQFGRMIALDQFTVNLNTPGTTSPKFVRVNISVEVPTIDTENEVTQKMPQVRNAIIDLFNSKRPTDLATVEGRDYIKEEIRNALNGFITTGKVKGVFFTNFAVGS